jgi:uncharacterized protein (DUF2236 family)
MDGYFSEASVIRLVHRNRLMALAGPRALLMQAAHPVAFAGFFASTETLDDPHARLRHTGEVLNTIVFGDRESAEHATAEVRAVHRRIHGELTEPAGRFPAGTRWAADDPGLLLWILATLVDSSLIVYDRYIGALDRPQRESYWEDYRIVGSLFGLADRDMPDGVGDLEVYVADMLAGDLLHVSPRARELALKIVMQPPVPLPLRPLRELANFVTVGLLPVTLRHQYGLRWDPIREVTLRAGAAYTKHLALPALSAVTAPLRAPGRDVRARRPDPGGEAPRSRRRSRDARRSQQSSGGGASRSPSARRTPASSGGTR